GKTLASGSLDHTVRLWRAAEDVGVASFYEAMARQHPQGPKEQLNLIRACWGCYLSPDRGDQPVSADSKHWLSLGLEALDRLPPTAALSAEDRSKWHEAFQAALRK